MKFSTFLGHHYRSNKNVIGAIRNISFQTSVIHSNQITHYSKLYSNLIFLSHRSISYYSFHSQQIPVISYFSSDISISLQSDSLFETIFLIFSIQKWPNNQCNQLFLQLEIVSRIYVQSIHIIKIMKFAIHYKNILYKALK